MAITFDDHNPLLSEHQPSGQRFAEVAIIVVAVFAFFGDPPPHVNEAHYLGRLKHFWNPQWCAGDLFFQSNDAQLVFVWLFGWVTRFLSLSAAAWVGRILAWSFVAWAWQRLSWRLVPVRLAAVLSAAIFVTLNNHCQLAGEWVVGGVEAKSFAYGFVLLALRDVIDRRWNRAWLLLGVAVAFHPIVGGWSTVLCSGLWLLSDRRSVSVLSMWPGLVGGGLLALVGVVPALLLTWNEPPDSVAEASRIYVFERLPHHLAILSLPTIEVVRRLTLHGLLLFSMGVLGHSLRKSDSMRRIVQFAWGAALIAATGFVIELGLWNQPLVAARLLRYYWFRMTDFGAPMAVAFLLTTMLVIAMKQRRAWAAWALAATLIVVGCDLGHAVVVRIQNPVPPADVKIVDYDAWVEACEWVNKNTPVDAKFLTPRLNHTFKWLAGRPEVVNRKDIPQDARSIVEWQRRIKDIYYLEIGGIEQPLDSIGLLGTEQVRELAQRYGAQYVLMDRGQLLQLPQVFKNEEYVVYRIENGRTDGR